MIFLIKIWFCILLKYKNISSIVIMLFTCLEESAKSMWLKIGGDRMKIVRLMLESNFKYTFRSDGYMFHKVAC